MGRQRRRRRLGGLALCLSLVSGPGLPSKSAAAKVLSESSGVAVATIQVVGGAAEKSGPEGEWKEVASGSRLATGESLRTSAHAVARVDFRFMSVWLDPSTIFALAPSPVLSSGLVEGRLEQRAETGIIKLRTPEALVRGQGHLVVRRGGGVTRVSVLDGSFKVEARGASVAVRKGQGALVEKSGSLPPPAPLPSPPTALYPGSDPVYVVRGRPLRLSWSPSVPSHVQLLGVAEGEILWSSDVARPPVEVDWPHLGTFRWRVAAKGGGDLEGLPSREGVVCVVEE